MNKLRPKICIVATVPFALQVFMRSHIHMLANDYDVTLVTCGKPEDLQGLLFDNVAAVQIDFYRRISLLNDLRAMIRLYFLFRKNRYQIVHSLMPKTGLLAMLAARLAGAPHRVHIFTGQVWANKAGIGRLILKMMDRFIANCATDLLTDSFSQRDFLVEQRVVAADKIAVLAHGSVCGVDVDRFKFNRTVRERLRSNLHIASDAVVFIFLGRINRDKGVQDLVHAFVAMNRQFPNSHLLVVGPDESGLDAELQEIASPCGSHFSRIGYTDRPEDLMSCADVFCLPSYREGFGSVIIEAAAVGLPAVASRIYGLVDAVLDGKTGILHEPKNIPQIQEALLLLANNPELRQTMADRARQRAHVMFDQSSVTEAMREFYRQLLR